MAIELGDSVRRGWNRLDGYLKVLAFKTSLSLAILASPLMAETVNVDGTVKDKKNNPVENVYTSYKSGNTVKDSTTTDSTGTYHLDWTIVGIDPDKTNVILDYKLSQNYPNPFNPRTKMNATIDNYGTIYIYDLQGKLVNKINLDRGPGDYTVEWGGLNKYKIEVAAGMYAYRLIAGDFVESKKMILLKEKGGMKTGLKILSYSSGISASVHDNSADIYIHGVQTKDYDEREKMALPERKREENLPNKYQDKKTVTSASMYWGTHTPGDTLKFEKEGITNLYLPVTIDADITIDVVVNHGPVFEENIRDTILTVGDTLTFNLNDPFFYNDDQSIYTSDFIVNDSLFQFIATQPETLENILVYATDAFDSTLTDSSNRFSIFVRSSPNNPPSVSNVLITPTTPTIGDTLFLSYVYSDPDGDADRSLIEWYRNSQLTGVSGLIFLPDSAAANDTINSIVTPYDGELYGVPVGSNTVVIQPLPTRTLTGTITDYFAQAPANNILLISSIDSARTNAQGEFTLEAALAEEHIPILHPSILASGTILPASPNDTSLTLYIARGDSASGIDSTYFRDEVLSDRGGNPIPPDLIYVAMTAESAPDTAFILGYIERDDGFVVSVGFQNVSQLNRQSGVINQEGNIVTKGLYNVDSTTIDIADTVFMNPDSTALFEWVNMAPDSNNVFPVNNPEEFRKTLFIRASNNVLGGNGTFLENYAITGGTIILKKDLTPNQMEIIMKEELISHLVSGVESDVDYPSIFDKAHSILYPHDIRMINWIYFRGPGRTYPDFPIGFDPALIERHAPGVLEKIKVSKNLPVDFSKYHLDEATGIYLKK